MATPPFAEVYQQFQVDAPRIHFYIDGEKETDVGVLSAYLLQCEDSGVALLHSCTQTALAPVYIDKWRQVTAAYGEFTHLVDAGPQAIHISDAGLVITKPFTVMRESAGRPPSRTTTMSVLAKTTLTLQIDHRGRILKRRWSRKRVRPKPEGWYLVTARAVDLLQV